MICDRCKKEIPRGHSFSCDVFGIGMFHGVLCDECANELAVFLRLRTNSYPDPNVWYPTYSLEGDR